MKKGDKVCVEVGGYCLDGAIEEIYDDGVQVRIFETSLISHAGRIRSRKEEVLKNGERGEE